MNRLADTTQVRPSAAHRGALLVLLLVSSAVAAPKPRCTDRQEGDVAIRESTITARRPGRLTVARLQTRNLVTDEESVTITVKRGSKTILESATTFGYDKTVEVRQTYGRGFKGIGTMTLRRGPAGDAVTVDGRAVSVAGLDTDPPTLVFEDGGATPKLRMKRSVRRVLTQASRLADEPCPAAGQATLRDGFNDPFADECETCITTCWGEMYACTIGTVGAGSVLSFVDSNWGCGGSLKRCVEACNATGHECCRAFCGTNCCGRNVDPANSLCIGATPTFPGTCCDKGDACGTSCCTYRVDLHGYYPQTCTDAGRSLCCDSGATACDGKCCAPDLKCSPDPLKPGKSVCCAGDPCGAYCCNPDQRCASPSDDYDLVVCVTCPPDKTGVLCGGTCCAAGEVCGFGGVCCTPDHLCGGTCCNNMANCINGTQCCEPPLAPCGATCCPALTTTCCNGQCCAGVCQAGGVCCPSVERTCGDQCCPSNYTCQGGTCTPCGCPDNTECCPGTGLCCSAPNICCTPEGMPKGCYSGNTCAGLG